MIKLSTYNRANSPVIAPYKLACASFMVFVLFVFIPNHVQAEEIYDAQAKCEQLINMEVGGPSFWDNLTFAISKHDAKSFKDQSAFAGAFGFPGKDMYLEFYYRAQWQTFDKALETVANETGYTTNEIQAIIQGATVPILRSKPRINKIDALSEVKQIQDIYNREKDLLDFQQSIQAEQAPTSIFSNGSTADSGIDLITDLKIIEKILFLGVDSVDKPRASIEKKLAETQKSDIKSYHAAVQSDLSAEEINPAQCSTDSTLEAALTSFETSEDQESAEQQQEDVSDIEGETNEEEETQQQGDTSKDESSSDEEDETDSETDDVETSGEPVQGAQTYAQYQEEFINQDIPAAQADDWSLPPLCGDVFCLEILFQNRKNSAYKDTDNCIACHIEKMSDILADTTSNDLSPKKVPGNLLEPNWCKNGALGVGDVKIDFNVLTTPVLPPPKDDAIKKEGSFKQHAERYSKDRFQLYSSLVGNLSGGELGESKLTPDPTSIISGHEIARQTEGQNLKNVQERITSLLQARDEAEKRATFDYTTLSSLQNQASYYQALIREIETMLTFFTTYNEEFKKMVKGNNNVCDAFKQKEYCK